MSIRKPAEERKRDIAEATLALAAQEGPELASTQKIARLLDLTEPAIFRHFPTKADLWRYVVSLLGERMEKSWLAAGKENKSPARQLRVLVVEQLKLIQTVPALPSVLFSRGLQSEGMGLRTLLVSMMARFSARIGETMRAGIEAGEFRASLDVERGAWLVVALIQGTAMRWTMGGRSFDIVAEGECLLDELLDGLRAADNGGAETRP